MDLVTFTEEILNENITYNKPGPSNLATNANPQSPIEMFDLFCTNQMFEDITKYTYSKIRMFCNKISEVL